MMKVENLHPRHFFAFLSQTNDVEWWWNDDENEPLCLVPLYILSINGQTENDIGNDIGTSLQPVVGYRLLYLLNIQSHVNDLRMTIK